MKKSEAKKVAKEAIKELVSETRRKIAWFIFAPVMVSMMVFLMWLMVVSWFGKEVVFNDLNMAIGSAAMFTFVVLGAVYIAIKTKEEEE